MKTISQINIMVPEEYFLSLSETLISSLKNSAMNFPIIENAFDSVHRGTLEKLGKLPQNIGILCGGGVDSTYLLVACSLLKKNITAISSISDGNEKSLQQIDAFCLPRGHVHIKRIISDDTYSRRAAEFEEMHGRAPRDPVAPVVSELSHVAKEHSVSILVDGQYADTVLFQNPQNKLFKSTWFLPKIPSRIRNINETHDYSKKIQLFTYLSLSLSDKILYLCRIEITEASTALVEHLLSQFDANMVLQLIFWHALLNYRERDKYKCVYTPVYSPFEEISYIYMLKGRDFKMKEEMKYFIKKNSGIDLSVIRSRSFRRN